MRFEFAINFQLGVQRQSPSFNFFIFFASKYVHRYRYNLAKWNDEFLRNLRKNIIGIDIEL